MFPTHVPGSSPTVLAQTVESAVIADAKRGVGVDVVPCVLAETGPPIEEPWPSRHNGGYRVAAIRRLGRERGVERRHGVTRLRVQHRLGWTGTGERHGPRFGHRMQATCGWPPVRRAGRCL